MKRIKFVNCTDFNRGYVKRHVITRHVLELSALRHPNVKLRIYAGLSILSVIYSGEQ